MEEVEMAVPLPLPREITIDILLRLPTKYILRCGAVCKGWRSFTTGRDFLATHARRQSVQVVLYRDLDVPGNHAPFHIALDVLPISSDEGAQRRLIRYPKKYPDICPCCLLSSCNGVLLFKRDNGSYILCNPTTRQWAELPLLVHNGYHYVYEYVFYFHQPSGNYKLLCDIGMDFSKIWCVLSTGAAEPQLVEGVYAEAPRVPDLSMGTPVDLHGRLHWPSLQQPSGTGETSEIVVFETTSETFHTMAGPQRTSIVKLFCMDGLLAAADFGVEIHINLWFLEDNVAGRWECRHRVDMSIPETRGLSPPLPPDHYWLMPGIVAADNDGNIMLGNSLYLAMYNVRNKTVREVDSVPLPASPASPLVSRHVFRKNIAPHPHFRVQSSAELQFNYIWN